MKIKKIISSGLALFIVAVAFGTQVGAATNVQIGTSGKTYASSLVQCAPNPSTGLQSPVIEAGLFNPRTKMSAGVSLNGSFVTRVTNNNPATNLWLADGNNTVVVSINKKTVDRYVFAVQPGICALPDTSGNTFSPDGILEYAASGKSSATVTPGCAWNARTGSAQPYVYLFDNGNYLLNVSVNGIPLTQLSALRPHTPVFLSAGVNVISAANASLSVDYFVRDGGDGTCTLQ